MAQTIFLPDAAEAICKHVNRMQVSGFAIEVIGEDSADLVRCCANGHQATAARICSPHRRVTDDHKQLVHMEGCTRDDLQRAATRCTCLPNLVIGADVQVTVSSAPAA